MSRLRASTLVFLSIFSTSASMACEEAPATLGMRAAIYSNDVESVEASLERFQSEFEEDIRSADEIRCLFRHFHRTRPETAMFIDSWIEKFPASPLAQTAKAWNLLQASIDMRGSQAVVPAYPEAARLSQSWLDEVQRLANSAFATNPRLVPASDVLILSANMAGERASSLKVFQQIMARDPNLGSYELARAQHHPDWGYGWKDAEAFCDTFATVAGEEGDDPALICRLKVSPSFKTKRLWRIGQLKTLDRPDLDHLWLLYLTRSEASAEQAARAHAAITANDFYDVAHARRFDQNLAGKYGYADLLPGMTKRRVERAVELLPHDPYNPVLIKWRLEGATVPLPFGLQTILLQIPKVTPEEGLELTKRLVARSPYDQDAWAYFSWAWAVSNDGLTFDVNRAFLANRVVFSNHRMDDLKEYLGHVFIAEQELPKYVGETAVYDKYDTDAQYYGYFDEVDRDDDILCPYVRAMRLWDHLCDLRQGGDCSISRYVTNRYSAVEEEVETRGICTAERTMPLDELFFSPIPLQAFD